MGPLECRRVGGLGCFSLLGPAPSQLTQQSAFGCILACGGAVVRSWFVGVRCCGGQLGRNHHKGMLTRHGSSGTQEGGWPRLLFVAGACAITTNAAKCLWVHLGMWWCCGAIVVCGSAVLWWPTKAKSPHGHADVLWVLWNAGGPAAARSLRCWDLWHHNQRSKVPLGACGHVVVLWCDRDL